MNKTISKKTLVAIFRLSLFSSVLLMGCLFFAFYLSYHAVKEREVHQLIMDKIDSVSTQMNETNYPLLAKELKELTKAESLAIYSEYCEVLSATSWIFSKKDCLYQNETSIIFETSLHNKNLKFLVEYKFEYLKDISSKRNELITVFILFFIVTYIGIFLFIYFSFIKPIRSIEHYITESNEINFSDNEFSIITKELLEFKNLISKTESEKATLETARTLVHDIRNPLEILKFQIQDEFSKEEILSRTDEISRRIESYLKPTNKSLTIFSVEILRQEVILDSRILSPNIIVDIITDGTYLECFIPKLELKNILLNLIKNSYEASAKNITINITGLLNLIKIEVIDDGAGIKRELKEKIFQRNFTTKAKGNGIGLTGIKNYIDKQNGKFEIDFNYLNGARFLINFPGSLTNDLTSYVLIDNDKYIQKNWVLHARKIKLSLECFLSINDFVNEVDRFSKETRVFIDSDLGDGLKGELQSKELFDLGFKSIYLTTSYSDIQVSNYPWITEVLDKKPPF